MYLYVKSEPGLWTTGFYDPSGQWHAEHDCDSAQAAADRVAWLNGERERQSASGSGCKSSPVMDGHDHHHSTQVLGQDETFQRRVAGWMDICFPSSIIHDRTERGDRLLEEVLELLQANGYDSGRVAMLVEYVYNRPVGEPAQEVGGVMVTLAAYCRVTGLDMHGDGERELIRIKQPDVMARIRRKQEAKRALQIDSPLPGAAGATTTIHVSSPTAPAGDGVAREKMAPDGKRCLGFGVNENGQAECYWPDCDCRKNMGVSAEGAAGADSLQQLARHLLEVLAPRIAHSHEEAASMDEAGKNPIWCLADPLNPCWDEQRAQSATDGPLRHWAGGEACEECRIRQAFAACDRSIQGARAQDSGVVHAKS